MTFPTCQTCGHAQGDHQSAGSSFPHPPVYGVCLVPACKCTRFQPTQASRAA